MEGVSPSKGKPSFLGVRFGLGLIPGDYYLGDGSEIDFSSECTAGVEGAWFFTFHIGIGGELTATGLSWLFYFKALQTGSVSRVAPIDKLSVVMTIIMASILLKEPVSVKEVLGALCITGGSILMLYA